MKKNGDLQRKERPRRMPPWMRIHTEATVSRSGVCSSAQMSSRMPTVESSMKMRYEAARTL